MYRLLLIILGVSCLTLQTSAKKARLSVLVFYKTAGFYHKSIPTGIATIQKMGGENRFNVDTTSNAALFNKKSLKKYAAIVFLNTTYDVLNAEQEKAFQEYIRSGGGFVGVHAATDTEYEWPWYNKLVGAYFTDHPKVQKARIKVTDRTHLSTRHLPEVWEHTDEWYNFKDINPDLNVLAWLDESSYQGGKLGDKHPIAWYHEFDGGKVFYTGLGHTTECYSEPLFYKHLLGGILYAVGRNK